MGGDTHWLAAVQQPSAQFTDVQLAFTQAPPVQRSSGRQARQRPPSAPQAKSSAPPRHWALVSRHPPQAAPTHSPRSQRSSAEHDTQELPGLPQALGVVPEAQVPSARQHPRGH